MRASVLASRGTKRSGLVRSRALVGCQHAILNVLLHVAVRPVDRIEVQGSINQDVKFINAESAVSQPYVGQSVVVIIQIPPPDEHELLVVVHALGALRFLFRITERRQDPEARIAMMAITMSRSIKVKPSRIIWFVPGCVIFQFRCCCSKCNSFCSVLRSRTS